MVFKEAEMLKSLNHKNIVKFKNCYTLENMQVVFIMEFLEGGELLEYLSEKGRLDEEEARFFFIQIIEAINYCHKEGLIHRDLKLENLLLKNRTTKEIKVYFLLEKKYIEIFKVVDFGIAGITTGNPENVNAGNKI